MEEMRIYGDKAKTIIQEVTQRLGSKEWIDVSFLVECTFSRASVEGRNRVVMKCDIKKKVLEK